MNACTFSVMVGRVSMRTDVRSYRRQLERMERGIEDLLGPLRKRSEVRSFRRIDPSGEEWIDVCLEPGPQGSMISELERSIGSTRRELDLAADFAQHRSQLPPSLLAELMSKRRWSVAEFLDFIERETLARAGRYMSNDQGELVVRTPDGRYASAPVPNRRFSAMRSDMVDLHFRPLMVGCGIAQIQLSKDSHRLVRSRSRRMNLHWNEESDACVADTLFRAAMAQHWVRGQCRVFDNRDGRAKSLFLEELTLAI